jgi:hypothetical protein
MCGFPDLGSREPMKAQFYEGKLRKDDVVIVDDHDNLLKWGLA